MNGAYFAISFNYFGNAQYTSSADNNIFYNCTLVDNEYLFESSRANTGSQFVNCIINNSNNYAQAQAGPGFSIDASYDTTNFTNLGWSVPSGTNITTLAPNFTGSEFQLTPDSALRGLGIETPFLSAGNDLGYYQSQSNNIQKKKNTVFGIMN